MCEINLLVSLTFLLMANYTSEESVDDLTTSSLASYADITDTKQLTATTKMTTNIVISVGSLSVGSWVGICIASFVFGLIICAMVTFIVINKFYIIHRNNTFKSKIF
jgi:hypothetical protein